MVGGVSADETQLDEGEVVAGTAEDITPEGEQATDGPDAGGELVPFTPPGQIIQAEKPAEVLVKATEVADALKDLIDKKGLAQSFGGSKKHVEVGGWQALGMLLGTLGGQPLHAETEWSRIVCLPSGDPVLRPYTAEVKRYHRRDQGGGLRETITYDVDGFDWEARVAIKLPTGVTVGLAEAMCSRTEVSWSQKPDPAVKSMAETRAESRAYRRAVGWIMNIAGYSPTPADEMPPQQAELPEAPPELAEKAKAAVRFLAGTNAQVLAAKVKEVGGGKLVVPAAQTLVLVEMAQRAAQQAQKAAAA